MDTESYNIPLYSSGIINIWVEFLKDKYPDINVNLILKHANIQEHEIADQGHWLTQEQVDMFYYKVLELTRNQNIAREAGRYLAKPGSVGFLWQYAFGQLGPPRIFERVAKAASYFAISSEYSFKRITSNKIEIISKPYKGIKEKEYQCENRIGIFEAIALGYTHRMPVIEHNECIFKGGDVCKYTISWRKSYKELFNRILSLVFLIFLGTLGFSFFKGTANFFSILLPFSIIFLLMFSVKYFIEKKELLNSLSILRESADNLIQQVNKNYNNTQLTDEVGQAVSGQASINDVLDSVVKIAEKRLDFDRGFILLSNKDRTRLMLRAGYGHSTGHLDYFPKEGFHLDSQESRGVFVISFKEQKSFLINNINAIKHDLSKRSLELLKKSGTKSFVCCPIVNNNESLGIIVVDNVKSKRPLIQSDLSLLTGLASVIGISIRNAMLLESKTRQITSTLHVLAASIDARDFLTAGHSEKVMEFAVGICQELGYSSEYTDMIRIAALLHDYGKIGVPDAILKKKGKLSAEEYREIQAHAEKSRQILEEISFEGIYRQVPEIAGCHHEKLDGSGYPGGLKGEEIPEGAKIIAVADFFEAITSKRHYRDPMPLDKAMLMLADEVVNNRLDPRLVEAFTRFYAEKYGWENTYVN